ncbi:hypothetical protein GCM10027075_43760 [Streptomyces heilongjiangensis]
MALVRKGSRRIVVDGTPYRWRLRGRPTYFQGLAWSPCTFAVEHADTPGALVVTIDQPHLRQLDRSRRRTCAALRCCSGCSACPERGPDSDGSGLRLDQSAGFTPSS